MGRIDVEIPRAPPRGKGGRKVAAHGANFQAGIVSSSKFGPAKATKRRTQAHAIESHPAARLAVWHRSISRHAGRLGQSRSHARAAPSAELRRGRRRPRSPHAMVARSAIRQFIHWGLYSVLGRHEWVMENEGIPVTEYEQLAKRFQPK